MQWQRIYSRRIQEKLISYITFEDPNIHLRRLSETRKQTCSSFKLHKTTLKMHGKGFGLINLF